MVEHDDLDGELTIEGPILETAYAAYSVIKGENVIPRKETLGVGHDLLIRKKNGYVFCEVDGGEEISDEKILLFRDDVTKLNDLLKTNGDAPIIEARFIAMLSRKNWSENANQLMDETEKIFEASSISLIIVEPKRLVYDLIVSSILGFILKDGSIILVGPGHTAIRYNASVSKFMFGGASINENEFRKLPQSFVTWDFWNKEYRNMYKEYSSFCKESPPKWLDWKVPEKFGIKWKSASQILRAIERGYSKSGYEIDDKKRDGFISVRKTKKSTQYRVNVVHHTHIMSSEDVESIKESFSRLLEDLSKRVALEENIETGFVLFTDTVTFSHSYWTNIKFLNFKGETTYSEIQRGDDLLIESLNGGVLGIRIDKNQIKLTLKQGPDTMNVVRGSLQWEPSEEGTYPATLKF